MILPFRCVVPCEACGRRVESVGPRPVRRVIVCTMCSPDGASVIVATENGVASTWLVTPAGEAWPLVLRDGARVPSPDVVACVRAMLS